MNINFPNSTSSSSRVDTQAIRTSRNSRTTQAAGNAESQAAAGSSGVTISETSVQALKAQLANLPSVRQDRVAALHQAVHNGSYQVNGRQLAEAIQADLFGPSNSGS